MSEPTVKQLIAREQMAKLAAEQVNPNFTPEQVGNDMLGILHKLCPTGVEQRQCTEIYWEAEKAQRGDGIRRLAGIIFDGLSYGNWPWTNYNVVK